MQWLNASWCDLVGWILASLVKCLSYINYPHPSIHHWYSFRYSPAIDPFPERMTFAEHTQQVHYDWSNYFLSSLGCRLPCTRQHCMATEASARFWWTVVLLLWGKITKWVRHHEWWSECGKLQDVSHGGGGGLVIKSMYAASSHVHIASFPGLKRRRRKGLVSAVRTCA